MSVMTSADAALFTDAQSRAIYDGLLAAARALGPFEIEPKKTCVHLVRRAAFAGAHPRKAAVLVTLKTDRPLEGPRVRKLEQASKSRFHNDILLDGPEAVDLEFQGWLRVAYDLAG